MILYFTGTGNSRYAAEYIGNIINDETVKINEFMKAGEKGSTFTSEKPFVFVCPAYAWRIPRSFSDFLAVSTFLGNKAAYFIITCGSDIGHAGKYVARLCKKIHLEFNGAASIVMPENYIARYEAPDPGEAERIMEDSKVMIKAAAEQIKKMEILGQSKISISDRFKSTIVNPVFYALIVKANGFYSTGECVGCGTCEEVCPFNNITLKENRPVWGSRCTHCMACICRCPKKAIEYKTISHGKERYYNALNAPMG